MLDDRVVLHGLVLHPYVVCLDHLVRDLYADLNGFIWCASVVHDWTADRETGTYLLNFAGTQ